MDEELLAHLRKQADDRRKHASFFAWYDRSADGKAIAETGVVRTLLESMTDAREQQYSQPRASGEQWPDCWAISSSGSDTPFEVSELVDASALPAGQDRPWTADQIRNSLQGIINKKDLRSLSRPGSRNTVLVIHTDEMYLNVPTVTAALADHRFVLHHGSIGRAFLLFSYDPRSQGYPYIELQLAA